MIWTPHLTVAAVIERDGQFLLVDENIKGNKVYNQPAGHLEDNETCLAAVIREVQEETAWQFMPDSILGIFKWRAPDDNTFFRICYQGQVTNHDPAQQLDTGIIAARWLTLAEITALPDTRLRSPLVRQCIHAYQQGQQYPLDIIAEL